MKKLFYNASNPKDFVMGWLFGVLFVVGIVVLFSSCMTTRVKTENGCYYYYRPSMKNARWRHL